MTEPSEQVKALWHAQPTEPLQALPTEELRRRAEAFQRRIARRNRREWVAGGVVIPVYLAYAWIFPYWVTKLGALLCVAGVCVLLWQLQRRAAQRPLPEALGQDLLAFHRAELQRQHDAVRTVWRWYLGPLLPGLAVFLWGRQQELSSPAAMAVHPWVLAIVAACLLGVLFLNQRAARRLRREIDALDALGREQE